MAITTPGRAGAGTYPIERIKPWAVNYHSANFTAAGVTQELKAAPTGAGKAHYVSHVTMCLVEDSVKSYLIDNTVTLKDGDGTVLFGPIGLQLGSSPFKKDFDPPIKLVDNKSLTCFAHRSAGSYDSACLVYVECFTGDKPLG